MKRAHVSIFGRVQGVCFRAATQRAALGFSLNGWVQNTQDGGVEAVFEGADDAVEKMIDWCRQGPPAARVDAVKTEYEAYAGNLHDFRIIYLP
ncbi:MAG: acylphosphatase [Smithellaceae bacterium]|jgi:acylphosphatase|nr:acylphosphatase [Syntrophaceae bacterium]MDD4240434.1 acylphosphatase [Smithellaceae bacterium]NLX51942.1 acylphosphatase [Deltaproteobacteria bacterium]